MTCPPIASASDASAFLCAHAFLTTLVLAVIAAVAALPAACFELYSAQHYGCCFCIACTLQGPHSQQHPGEHLQVINSKQRPRKLTIYGSDGREYQFLLKGHEDLRQDERVMQVRCTCATPLPRPR